MLINLTYLRFINYNFFPYFFKTQTDPRLKRKKFGPLNQDAGIDAMDFDEFEEDMYRRRRKKMEDDYGLFEEHEPRRKTIRRNTEEALKVNISNSKIFDTAKL